MEIKTWFKKEWINKEDSFKSEQQWECNKSYGRFIDGLYYDWVGQAITKPKQKNNMIMNLEISKH